MSDLDALAVANAFHKYARHLDACASRAQVRDPCDCGLERVVLQLDRAWKRGKAQGEEVFAASCGCPEHFETSQCVAGCRCACNADFVHVERWECRVGCGRLLREDEIPGHGCEEAVVPGKSTASCGHELAPCWSKDPLSWTITKGRTREGAKALCYAVDCEACRWSWERAGILFKTPEEAEAWLREPWLDEELVR